MVKYMKKCLLIGGAGFIGNNLAKELSSHKYEVTVLDHNLRNKEICHADNIAYVETDYFSEGIGDELLMQQDMVFLFACSVGPKTSMQHPDTCYGQDIIKMIELLDQMKQYQNCQLIFISSGGTVYGDSSKEDCYEGAQTFPINHYGIMKLTQEKIILMYNRLYGMKNVIFRLANPYGPGQKKSSGVGAVTAFLEHVLQNDTIHIFGKGEVIRDYIYIDDATHIMRLALEDTVWDDAENNIYNIGTGSGTSLIDLVYIIEKVTGIKADISFEEERNIDVKKNVLNIDKLCRRIGKYDFISVNDGIHLYYEYLKRNQ